VLRLALALDEGRGAARNPGEAHRLYREAAEAGIAEALYRLALQYDLGSGTARDARAALHYFSRAAEKGHEGARERISELLGPELPDPRFRGLR
jgi:hypothetical protein